MIDHRRGAPGHSSRADLIAAGITPCSVAGCDGYPSRKGDTMCRQCHPNRCLGWNAQSTGALPTDEEEGRCRNITNHPTGRCWLHRNDAISQRTKVEIALAA